MSVTIKNNLYEVLQFYGTCDKLAEKILPLPYLVSNGIGGMSHTTPK